MVEQLRHPERWFFISSFDDLGLAPALLSALRDLKYTEATDIQRLSIPPALEGRDVLASAPTGSGKSAAFGLPILQALLAGKGPGTRALILAPTRELAQQITLHLRDLAKHTAIRIAPVYGGVGMDSQIRAFRRGTEVIVATPGRLLDLVAQGAAKLDRVNLLVLDEADRMLDMGFLPDVRRILTRVPRERQTLFFSATLANQAGELARELLVDPVRVNLTPTTTPLETVTQAVYAVEQHKKTDLLVDLLKNNTIYNAIVFTRTKARAERVAGALQKHKIEAERIHGDRSQAQRTRALEAFKNGKHRVLVATDVAARGIDIIDLGHVVNYDVPGQVEDYIHRIGRTARAKRTGDAITFVCREEAPLFAQIERTIGTRVERTDHPLADADAALVMQIQPTTRRRTFQRRRRR